MTTSLAIVANIKIERIPGPLFVIIYQKLMKDWYRVGSYLGLDPYTLSTMTSSRELLTTLRIRSFTIGKFNDAVIGLGLHFLVITSEMLDQPDLYGTYTDQTPSFINLQHSPVVRLMGYEYLMSQATADVGKQRKAMENLIENTEKVMRTYPLLSNLERLLCSKNRKLHEHLEENPWLARVIHLTLFMIPERITIIKPMTIDNFGEEALNDVYNYASMKGLLGVNDDSVLLNVLSNHAKLRAKVTTLIPPNYCDHTTLMQNPGYILAWADQVQDGKCGFGERKQALLKCLYHNRELIPKGQLDPNNFYIQDVEDLRFRYLEMVSPKNVWTIAPSEDEWIKQIVDVIDLKSSQDRDLLMAFIRDNKYEKDLLSEITATDLNDAGITAKGIQAKILRTFQIINK